jgi:hypothetical protein
MRQRPPAAVETRHVTRRGDVFATVGRGLSFQQERMARLAVVAREFNVPRVTLVIALMLAWAFSPAYAQEARKPSAPSAVAGGDQDINLQAYVELLRSDVRAQKVAILTQLMDMDDKQDAAFWPVYRQYELDMAKLNDERVTLIREYAANFPDISDDVADRLIMQALSLEGRRSSLLARYYKVMKASLGAKAAAQFVQIEHQLLTLIDLQIASALPIVK